MSLVRAGAVADNVIAPANLVFGTASLSEVEAVLITAALAGILAAWGVITQRIVARRHATTSYLSRKSADKDMIDARRTFNKVSGLTGALSTYTQPSDLSDDETQAVRLILNDYELCSISVQHGVLDLSIIKQNGKGTILRDWSRAAPFVYKLRTELDNPAIFHEFEEMARWLQDNKLPRRSAWTRLWF